MKLLVSATTQQKTGFFGGGESEEVFHLRLQLEPEEERIVRDCGLMGYELIEFHENEFLRVGTLFGDGFTQKGTNALQRHNWTSEIGRAVAEFAETVKAARAVEARDAEFTLEFSTEPDSE